MPNITKPMSKTNRKSNDVDRQRLIWVIAALIAAMTSGTVILAILEPKTTLSNEVKYLAATYSTQSSTKISRTDIPIESNSWKAIIIHTINSDLKLYTMSKDPQNAPFVHFAISPSAEVLITTQWKEQLPVEGYQGIIHIGIILPAGSHRATLPQAQALVALIRDLQARCSISRTRIYLYSQLSRSENANPLQPYNWKNALLP